MITQLHRAKAPTHRISEAGYSSVMLICVASDKCDIHLLEYWGRAHFINCSQNDQLVVELNTWFVMCWAGLKALSQPSLDEGFM